MKNLFYLSFIFILFSCQNKKTQSTINSIENPFFQEWNTPFGVPPFNLIKDEHYMPAFEKGMKENMDEIDIIVNNKEKPTFENTIEALERTGKLLTKVQRVFSNLASSNTNPKLQELQRELSPLLSAHYDKISLNENLFLKLKKYGKKKIF